MTNSNLILGATGPVGTQLSKQEESALGVSKTSKSDEFNGELIHADITEEIPFKIQEFDTVYHLATLNNGTASRNQWPEVAGTEKLLEEAEAAEEAPHLVFVSSGAVAESDHHENRESEGLTYPDAKLLGEELAEQYQHSSIARLGNIYGGEKGVVQFFMEQAEAEEPLHIHGNGQQERSFIHIEDAVDAILYASRENQSVEAYEDHYPVGEIAGKISGLSGAEISYDRTKDSSSRYMPGDFQRYETEIYLDTWLEEQLDRPPT